MKQIQLDMFSSEFDVEVDTSLRLSKLEEQQEKLRRGLFKRWGEQEKKIKTLHKEFQILTGILEGAME